MAAICKKINIPCTHVALSSASNDYQKSTNDENFLFAKTPDRSISGATPARFDGGVTPARTPSRESMTPSRDVWSAMTPGPEGGMTPRVPRTPRTPRSPVHTGGNDDDDFADAELYNQPWTATPNPTTPHTPITPMPNTPCDPKTPKTPKTPFTPAQTPGPDSKEESEENEGFEQPHAPETPFPPATPITPAVPITPVSPSYSPVPEEEDPPRTPLSPPRSPEPPPPVSPRTPVPYNGSKLSLAPGVVVRSIEESDEEPEYGIVTEISDSMVTVQLASGASKTTPSEQWQGCPPVKNDMVYIAADEHVGKVGKLIGIDSEDGIVRVVNEENLRIVPLSTLLKYRDSD